MLHKIYENADIIFMENLIVVLSFIGLFFFFFPIFLNTTIVYYDKKIGFSLYLFSFFKLVSGYITFHKEAFAVHISDKKAFYIRYLDMKNEGKKFAVTQGFQLYSVHLITEFDKNKDYAVYVSLAEQFILRFIYIGFHVSREYLSLKSDLLLSNGPTNVSLNTVTVFNFFTLVRAVVKITAGRIITSWWKKKRKLKI